MTDMRQIISLTVGLVGTIVAIAVGATGFDDWKLHGLGRETPQEIRVADLEANGPGDNVHVKLTDFQLGKDYVVQKINGNWAGVYVPVYPRGMGVGADDQAETPKVVIKTGKMRSRDDVMAYYGSRTVTGVITNSIDKANFDLREFQKKFPNLKPSEVWLVDERSFPSDARLYFNVGLAGFLLLTGIVSFVVCWKVTGKLDQATARAKQEFVVFRR